MPLHLVVRHDSIMEVLYCSLPKYVAVTHASIENWEYMEIIRQAADFKCSQHLENSIQTIDAILLRGDDPVSKALKRRLKGLFGLAGLEHDEDFASMLEVCHAVTTYFVGFALTIY